MTVKKDEHVELFKELFMNKSSYDKWAPCFYQEFVKKNSVSVLAGVMTPDFVVVNDSLDCEFISWLKEKGVNI